MSTFNIGAEVQHLANARKMVVESVNGDSVTCVWFVGGDHKREMFAAAMLKPYKAPPTFRLASFSKGFSRG